MLTPVMYAMARDMLWRYGYLNGLFKSLGHTDAFDVKFGDVKRITFITTTTNDKTKAFAETILQFGSFVDAFGDVALGSGTILEKIDEMNDDEVMEEVADY